MPPGRGGRGPEKRGVPLAPPLRVRGGRRSAGPLSRSRSIALWAVPVLLVLAFFLFRAAHHASRPQTRSASWSEERPPEEESLRRAVAQRPGDAGAHLRLGQYYLHRVLPYEAIWEMVETLALRPENGGARAGLAAALDAVSLPEMAREQLQPPVPSPLGDRERRMALARLELRC